jgi:hypothetical protein
MLSCDFAREVAARAGHEKGLCNKHFTVHARNVQRKSLRKKALSQHPDRRKRLPKRAHVLFFAPILFHAAKLLSRIA